MKLVNSTIPVHITGIAGCGKTVLADRIAQMVRDAGDTVTVVDEYRTTRAWKEEEKQKAVASKPDVLIIIEETDE